MNLDIIGGDNRGLMKGIARALQRRLSSMLATTIDCV
jgi:hypothetical protein